MNPDDYEFSVASVTNRRAGASYEATTAYPILDIRPQDTKSTEFFGKVWAKCANVVRDYSSGLKQPVPGWCHWDVARWAKEPLAAGQLRFSAWEGDAMAGFLNLRVPFGSQIDSSLNVVYIEHVATAPGHLSVPIWGRRLHGVGKALIAFAVLTSYQLGNEGRVALHAADDEASGFYDALNSGYQERLFPCRKTGVAGPIRPNQPNTPGLDKVYFEADGVVAAEFLAGYRSDG